LDNLAVKKLYVIPGGYWRGEDVFFPITEFVRLLSETFFLNEQVISVDNAGPIPSRSGPSQHPRGNRDPIPSGSGNAQQPGPNWNPSQNGGMRERIIFQGAPSNMPQAQEAWERKHAP
jgi:hypothetical protein